MPDQQVGFFLGFGREPLRASEACGGSTPTKSRAEACFEHDEERERQRGTAPATTHKHYRRVIIVYA
ncbi:hypothetical protein EBZ57_01915 [bacterium]|nr:hypothetical protein [bacterium]